MNSTAEDQPSTSTRTSSTNASFYSATDVPSFTTPPSSIGSERERLLPFNSSTSILCCTNGYRAVIDSDDDDNYDDQENVLYKQRRAFVPATNYYIYLVTIVSAIGGFLFGYDTGIISGAMVFIKDYYELDVTWHEIVVSSTILSAWVFSYIAGWLTDAFGRKKVILLASLTFTAGGALMAFSISKYDLVVGRLTVGCAIGLASMAIPVYIAEVAPLAIRGKLVTINNACITFGQFIASVLAGIFSADEREGWRWMLGLAAVPSIIQFGFFLFMPESPRWLAHKGRYERARLALNKFRAADTAPAAINAEFEAIKDGCLASASERGGESGASLFQVVACSPVRKALLIGCLLMAFQQLSGINTVMYYSATIIQMSGVSNKSLAVWLSAATASFNFIFSFVGIFFVERVGRRVLTLASLLGVLLALLLLAGGFQLAEDDSPEVTFHVAVNGTPWAGQCSELTTCSGCVNSGHCGFCFVKENGENALLEQAKVFWRESLRSEASFNGSCLAADRHDPDRAAASYSLCANGTADGMTWASTWCPSRWSWTTLAGLMLYLVFFAPGMGPMPWTVNSEIYPLWARSTCYSVATSVNWFFNLLVSLTFLTLTKVLTKHGAFYFYAGIAGLGWVLIYLLLPETKGKTFEEIEVLLEGPMLVPLAGKRNEDGYQSVGGQDDRSDDDEEEPTSD